LIALPLAVGSGLVLGAGNATWGAGWVRGMFQKLRDDRELDRAVSGVLVAAALVGGVLALGIAKLSVPLVGDVQRKASVRCCSASSRSASCRCSRSARCHCFA